MGTRIKTTIEIADSLLAEARRIAAREGSTVRALVESGLRSELAQRRKRGQPFVLRRASFKGKGLQPGLQGASWETIRDLIYEGHGG